jgi:hypothetical protein
MAGAQAGFSGQLGQGKGTRAKRLARLDQLASTGFRFMAQAYRGGSRGYRILLYSVSCLTTGIRNTLPSSGVDQQGDGIGQDMRRLVQQRIRTLLGFLFSDLIGDLAFAGLQSSSLSSSRSARPSFAFGFARIAPGFQAVALGKRSCSFKEMLFFARSALKYASCIHQENSLS